LFERGEADELFAKMNGALMAGDAISAMPLRRAPYAFRSTGLRLTPDDEVPTSPTRA
jgi:hypothetical protein